MNKPRQLRRTQPSQALGGMATTTSRSTLANGPRAGRCNRRRHWRFDMANAAAPTPKANMGAPAPRYDARLKVTGEARYPADMPVANPAFAVLVTSSIAKGRIERFDLDDARAVP